MTLLNITGGAGFMLQITVPSRKDLEIRLGQKQKTLSPGGSLNMGKWSFFYDRSCLIKAVIAKPTEEKVVICFDPSCTPRVDQYPLRGGEVPVQSVTCKEPVSALTCSFTAVCSGDVELEEQQRRLMELEEQLLQKEREVDILERILSDKERTIYDICEKRKEIKSSTEFLRELEDNRLQGKINGIKHDVQFIRNAACLDPSFRTDSFMKLLAEAEQASTALVNALKKVEGIKGNE